MDDIVSQPVGIWYHQEKGEVEKLGLRIEKLKFEKKQYEDKKKQFKKPKGIKAGCVFLLLFQFLEFFFRLYVH